MQMTLSGKILTLMVRRRNMRLSEIAEILRVEEDEVQEEMNRLYNIGRAEQFKSSLGFIVWNALPEPTAYPEEARMEIALWKLALDEDV